MSVRARIDHRVKQLTEGLRSELQVSPERSLRGGPRAARRAVLQLIRLGKSAQVCFQLTLKKNCKYFRNVVLYDKMYVFFLSNYTCPSLAVELN